MNFKPQLQLELREAIRAQDRPRVECLRMVLAAYEKVQERMGRQAFETAPDGTAHLPDRQQALTLTAIAEILQAEIAQRREAADQLHAGGDAQRARREETQIAILQQVLEQV